MSLARDLAQGICRDLAREAVGDGARCTWFGPVPAAGGRGAALRTLDHDLYGGLAGVAWTMAETAALTGDGRLADVARRALRQAEAVVARTAPGPGLYDGLAGVAVAAARIGLILDDPWAAGAARDLSRRAGEPSPGAPDLVSGAPGQALGLAVLGALRADAGPVARARRLVASPMPPPLPGLAHGDAGWALALDALGHRDAAAATLGRRPAPAAGRWCRGAAGVLLARHRVTPRDPDADALRTVVGRAVEARLATVGAEMCLCHGLAGDVEVLRQTGDDRHTAAVVTRIADQWDDAAGVTLTGPGGPGPGLMDGRAGIAAFLLRVHDPRVPTPLVVTPDVWARGRPLPA